MSSLLHASRNAAKGNSRDCQTSQSKKFRKALENDGIYPKIFRCLIVFQFPDDDLPRRYVRLYMCLFGF